MDDRVKSCGCEKCMKENVAESEEKSGQWVYESGQWVYRENIDTKN